MSSYTVLGASPSTVSFNPHTCRANETSFRPLKAGQQPPRGYTFAQSHGAGKRKLAFSVCLTPEPLLVRQPCSLSMAQGLCTVYTAHPPDPDDSWHPGILAGQRLGLGSGSVLTAG